MKTAVIYARYSSDNQTEQSIEGQLHVCQQYAQNNDILILDTYIDRAMTGTNDLRPDFQRMIKDSNKRQWDYVLVYKLDRFSRNKYEATIHKHTLKENGVKVLSAMENIPDTPEGIILESLLEGMNQYYSAELSQKVHRGLNESYAKGNFTGGNQIYGYDVKDKKNIINEEEAEIVKEIFTKFGQGFTGVSIAKDFKNRGVRLKTGHLINDKAVYKIIANTKYNGKVTHNGVTYDNIYPAIIDDATWIQVQEIRNKNRHFHGRKKDKPNYLLSSKLICGYCGRSMVGESGTSHLSSRYNYYNCLTKRRYKGDCEFKPKKKSQLEELVINTTWNLLCDDTSISTLANLIYKQHEEACKNNNILKSLINKKQTASKAANNLISAVEQGIVTEQTKRRLKELETEISQLEFEIAKEKQRAYTFLTKENIEVYLSSIIKGDIQNIQIQKQIIKTFIREIVVYNHKIVIVYNFTEKQFQATKNPDEFSEIIKETSRKSLNLSEKGSYIDAGSPPSLVSNLYLLINKFETFLY